MVKAATKKLLKGDFQTVAQCLTLIEEGDPQVRSILKAIGPHTGRAHVVGITGAPGTGKSTLISAMTAEIRCRAKRVGILTVDPTGPFSGGALLGDRIRMREHFMDHGVFIRSLATRGNLGGVALAVRDSVQVLDASGMDYVLTETIGVGQDQVAIAGIAHTVVVAVIPSMGDEIQAMKAGLLEIADILVINKADLPGAEQSALELSDLFGDRGIPILKTSALENQGIAALIDALEAHRAKLWSGADKDQRRLRFSRIQLHDRLRDRLLERVVKRVGAAAVEKCVGEIAERRLDPEAATDSILRKAGF